MKIRPLEADLLRVDGWIDRQAGTTKLIVPFRNFANAPKNCNKYICGHHNLHTKIYIYMHTYILLSYVIV